MRIATVRNETDSTDGKLYFAPGLSGSFVLQTLPTAVLGNAIRPSRVIYKNRWYVAGFYSTPIVVTEGRQNCIVGIPAPPQPPVLTAGTGSGGSADGELCIGYLTFVHKFNNQIVHEGNPSTPSQTFTLNGTGRTWSNIPTTCINPRATHVRGYASIDGDIPKFVWERQIGVSTVTENLLTSQRGVELPVKQGSDGATIFDPNARGIPPSGPFVEVYHDATWWTSYTHPNRIYPSKLFEPESVNVTEEDKQWLETLDGEPITGVKRYGDTLIVACARAMYAIQGYTNRDYQIVKISNFYGCISNATMVTLGPNSDLVFLSQEGAIMYNGAFRELMADTMRNYFRDAYRADPTNYEQSFAGEDRFQRGYKVCIPQSAEAVIQSFYYFGHYDFLPRTGRYEWVFDKRARKDNALGSLISGGDLYGDLYTGSCDGEIRKENVASNSDDDGDTYGKAMAVTHKHLWYEGNQAGDWAHGGSVVNLDIYCKHQSTAIALSLYCGDDSARDATSPSWGPKTYSAMAVASPRAKVPQTSDTAVATETAGKGAALRVTASTPVGVEWRGFGLSFKDGPQAQKFAS